MNIYMNRKIPLKRAAAGNLPVTGHMDVTTGDHQQYAPDLEKLVKEVTTELPLLW